MVSTLQIEMRRIKMDLHAVLPAVTRRRKKRTRNARGSAGKTGTGAEMRENVPAARRAKTKNGSENASANGSASLRAIKEM